MRNIFLLIVALIGCCLQVKAQHSLYPGRFDLQEVTLLDGPFKTAQDLNYSTLLEYDVDRMLTPYIRQSGLSRAAGENSRYYQWEYEHPCFVSFAWNPAMAMDGHILGHYLSALSISYASCHDSSMRRLFKKRIDYIITILNDCQQVFDNDKNGMRGFLGGSPDNMIWGAMLQGDYHAYTRRGNWVPFYCQHKILAGLRDAWVYAGNETSKEMFRKLCDWSLQVVSLFSEDIMELQILTWETGGMNEVLADAYAIFGENKYMKGAQKFSHQILIENMNQDTQHEFLDQKHANELTAMFFGFSRMGELKHDNRYIRSARNYWNDAAIRRSTAIGGAGIASYYLPAAKGQSHIKEADGPDFCNTYNLLKLTESLFSFNHHAKYAEYYERALLNHVLASQDPATGGYTYYTSLRPESYRIYSTMNESMWCCVGTGMESHSKYGDFIYATDKDTVFVNLFIASELKNSRVELVQESQYPYGKTSRITIKKAGNYPLLVRHPSWATDGYRVLVNGKEPKGYKPEEVIAGKTSYVNCGRNWKAGDVIEIEYPMSLTFVNCPSNPNYIALRYGPSVLAIQTTQPEEGKPNYEKLHREYASDGMRDFSPASVEKFENLAYAPMLICELEDVPDRVTMVDEKTLTFDIDVTAIGTQWKHLPLKPFFALHHSRYSIYMNRQNETAWMRNPLYRDQLRTIEMAAMTYDEVTPGESVSEKEHGLYTSETGSRGMLNGKPFRDAQPEQWFEYVVSLQKGQADLMAGNEVALVCRFSLSDRGRSCDIIVDGKPVQSYKVPTTKAGASQDRFYEEAFVIPAQYVKGKQQLKIRFASEHGSFVPRLYQLRVMKNDKKTLFPALTLNGEGD